ncbi:hypothetical protein FRC0360_00715 [Corynebacterium diphtheriae]|nr:hypothetical protein FRC0360_00715 [Corynebacterium diphtheriae]
MPHAGAAQLGHDSPTQQAGGLLVVFHLLADDGQTALVEVGEGGKIRGTEARVSHVRVLT